MGRRLIALIHEDSALQLSAALEQVDSPHLGADAGELAGVGRFGVPVASVWTGPTDVLVDFSTTAGVTHWLRACVDAQRPYLTGVTNLSAEQDAQIDTAGRSIAVLTAPNMSLGVNLLLRLVEQAARVLRDYDAEIVEAHHRFKKDAPSGTALALCRAVQAGTARRDRPRPCRRRPLPPAAADWHARPPCR
jgi:4-hydroxy-tetrahydrodipicolinate reductase